jgi:hypothetical protein
LDQLGHENLFACLFLSKPLKHVVRLPAIRDRFHQMMHTRLEEGEFPLQSGPSIRGMLLIRPESCQGCRH